MPGFKSPALIAGEIVNATMPEINTAPASVNANSRNSDPVSPPWKPIGRYTAASVTVIEMTGPTSSRAPRIAASKGFIPSDKCRSTFSTITMASSTTNPTHSTIASSVSRFTVNPAICIRNTAPKIDNGIATTGTRTARTDPRKR